MKLIDFYPLKGTFKPGETIQLQLKLFVDEPTEVLISLKFWHLAEQVGAVSHKISLIFGEQTCTLEWIPPLETPRGYGVVCTLSDGLGQTSEKITSAFDVLPDWTAFPRYGFLTDFTAGRGDVESTLESLVRFHINGLQFYDWQYRHDQLLPPAEVYIDPLERRLSLKTVRNFIEGAHKFGMAAMPYLAVYAASLEFWRDHPDWAIYDEGGQPMTFMDFLGLMDPTSNSPWIRHLQQECQRMLTELPFDGLHVDQYGDPKEGYNVDGEAIDIPAAFNAFISTLKDAYPNEAVVFNAVGNWPIEALGPSAQDFTYIEIWPPKTSYLDLPEVVSGARELSGGKPVVIALYLPADRPANIRLADALIYSCGGSRIELGENTRLLSDPYFPEHQEIPPELEGVLRKYHDFAVRYGDLIGPGAEDLHDWPVDAPPGVWSITRKNAYRTTVSLVNFNGIDDSGWDQPHPELRIMENLAVEINFPDEVQQVYWASPDSSDIRLKPISWQQENEKLKVHIPSLEYWGIIVVEMAK